MILAGIGVVVHQAKLYLPEIPACHKEPVHVLTAPLPAQLPTNIPQKAMENVQSTWTPAIHMEDQEAPSPWFLASARLFAGHCGQQGSESADRNSVSDSLSKSDFK